MFQLVQQMLIVLYIQIRCVKSQISHIAWQVKGTHARTQHLHIACAVNSCIYPNFIFHSGPRLFRITNILTFTTEGQLECSN
jgi:hypothetical protein